MKITNLFGASILVLSGQVAVAETKFPDEMKMADAIKNVIAQARKSEYKQVEVVTAGGTFSGEIVKQSGDVLILKQMTGKMNLKHNKERVQYFLVNISAVTGISFHVLD